MNTKAYKAMLAGVTVVAMCGSAIAQTRVTFSGDGRPSKIFRPVSGLNGQDASFLKDAAYANMFEIETSKLAQEKGSSDFTKEFSKEMIDDHNGSMSELQEIAAAKGFALPKELPTPLQKVYNRLSRLNGDAFDSAYRKAQLDGHSAASIKFKKEIDNGRDQDIKAYAVKTLPAVTMHYKLAKIQRTMMGSTKADHGI